MTEGIIKETKNSRLLKADLPATYSDLVSLAAGAGIPADVLFHAEGWQQLPTFLNKKTLLQDSTASVLGLSGDPTVDDAFLALLLVVKQAALMRVSVTVNGSPAIADIEVTGITGLDGGPVFTDSNGMVVAFAEAGEVNISTPTYQDLPAASIITRQVEAGEIVDVTLEISSAPQPGDKTVTTTTDNIRFSPYVTGVDVCCVGGGQGGYCVVYSEDGDTEMFSGGNGGMGSSPINTMNITPDTKTTYTAVVGAGGIGGQVKVVNRVFSTIQPTTPGVSSFMGCVSKLTDSGGSGDIYSIYSLQRTPPTPGIASGTYIFNDSSMGKTGGGGGGSGGRNVETGASGGSPNGGKGGDSTQGSYDNTFQGNCWMCRGENGKGPGGGGGGGFFYSYNHSVQNLGGYNLGGNGGSGLVRYRWRVS